MSSSAFVIKRGDTLPAIESTLYESVDGVESVVSLAGASAVYFRLREAGANGEFVFSKEGSIIAPASDGVVAYDWEEGDTETPGKYVAEWEVHFGPGKIRTFPSISVIPVTILNNISGSSSGGSSRGSFSSEFSSEFH
jgi:hypothetical protein